MKRLTDKRLAFPPDVFVEYTRKWRQELDEIPLPNSKELYYRLALIEDILGEDYDLDRLKVLLSADAEAAIHIGTCEFCEHYTFDKFCCCPAWVEEGDVIRRGAHDYCSKFKKASWVDEVWGENGCPSCPGYKPEKAEQEE